MSQIQETSKNLNVIKIADAERAADLLVAELAAQRELLSIIEGKNSLFIRYNGYAISYKRLYASQNELPFEPGFTTLRMNKFKARQLLVKSNIAESRLLLEKSDPASWILLNNEISANKNNKYSAIWSVNTQTADLTEIDYFLADPCTEYKILNILFNSGAKLNAPIAYAEFRENRFIFVALSGKILSCDGNLISYRGTGEDKKKLIVNYAQNTSVFYPVPIDYEWALLCKLK